VPHVPEDVIDPGQLTGILGRHKAFGSQTGDGQLKNEVERQADYSLDYASVPMELRMNGTFELPIGPNKLLFANSSGWVARLLERWQTSIVYNWGSGQPRDTFSGQHLYAGGGGNQPQARPDIVGPVGQSEDGFPSRTVPTTIRGRYTASRVRMVSLPIRSAPTESATRTPWVSTLRASCTLMAMAAGRTCRYPGRNLACTRIGWKVHVSEYRSCRIQLPGNSRATQGARMLRLPGRWFFDANIAKSFQISESKSIQIRFDANNILNHPNPGEPNFNVQSENFGRVTADKVANNTQRSFQGNFV
jgi:hypothetical protein